jgi:hypothetical protein
VEKHQPGGGGGKKAGVHQFVYDVERDLDYVCTCVSTGDSCADEIRVPGRRLCGAFETGTCVIPKTCFKKSCGGFTL